MRRHLTLIMARWKNAEKLDRKAPVFEQVVANGAKHMPATCAPGGGNNMLVVYIIIGIFVAPVAYCVCALREKDDNGRRTQQRRKGTSNNNGTTIELQHPPQDSPSARHWLCSFFGRNSTEQEQNSVLDYDETVGELEKGDVEVEEHQEAERNVKKQTSTHNENVRCVRDLQRDGIERDWQRWVGLNSTQGCPRIKRTDGKETEDLFT